MNEQPAESADPEEQAEVEKDREDAEKTIEQGKLKRK